MGQIPGIRTRPATPADAAAIAEIYNQGIAERIATFETEPRTPAQIAAWLKPGNLVIVAAVEGKGPVAFAASFPYSPRPCYTGIGEFSVYAARDFRGCGVGKAVVAALIEAARSGGLHKLTSRVFPENEASRGLLKSLGFEEIGIHRRHGKLDGIWRDCVIVERLLGDQDNGTGG
jgi:phosphinothricin acetyltransferase